MDGLLVIRNTNEVIDEKLKLVYRDIFELKKTHSSSSEGNDPNIRIKIEGGKVETELYNEADDFNFSIIRFPDISSSLSNNIKATTVYTEALRTANVCSTLAIFSTKSYSLRNYLTHQEYYPEFVDVSMCF